MSEWQDISTAPFTMGDHNDRWLDWCLLFVPDEHGGVIVVGGMDAEMWLYRDSERCCGLFEKEPTHWMPLPEPPDAA